MSAGPYDKDPDAIDELLSLLGTTESQLLERLRFLEFQDSDAKLLEGLHGELDGYWNQFSDRFYAHLNSYPVLRRFLDERLERLKRSQATYFSQLMSGRYDTDYVRNRISVGLAHQRIGLSAEWYLGAYSKYLVELAPVLWKIAGGDFDRFQASLSATRKIIFFDIGIALDTYFAAGRKAIADGKHFEEELAYQTTHDRLTGLLNHAALERQLTIMAEAAAEARRQVAVLILRLEDFQAVQASVGHASSDQLLVEIARRLESGLPQGWILSRYDSVEFAIVAPLEPHADAHARLHDAVFSILSRPFPIAGAELNIRYIAGGAIYPADASNTTSLLRHAAIALHCAQEGVHGSCLFFSAEMHQRVRLERDLFSAVPGRQLYLEYQPIVNLKTGRLSGIEALVRWRHPELGLLLPPEFISLAEETQLIDLIGNWVLEQACADAARWFAGTDGIRLSINISPKQLDNPMFAAQVAQTLARTGLRPDRLSLEITENVALKNAPQSRLALESLKNSGVMLTLDDFGTGYSSLSHLKNLPVDGVKIDLGAVDRVGDNADGVAIVNAVISMAHSLGVRASAVGIETEEQCVYLREHMCDEIQGFYYSPPLSEPEIAAFIVANKMLPEHLLRLHKPQRTLLLVDDESNILASLKRLFRQDGYRILTAGSGQEGLEVLEKNEVDVIISDQRMPGMMGVEFLRLAKNIRPDTVRIVLSGYTELQSVTDAVNEGAIYKFLTKPWEDQLLRKHIAEAFTHKEMADENQRLSREILTANQELAAANRKMEKMLEQKQEQIVRNEVSLDIVREILQHIAVPLIGIDESNLIAFANHSAETLFSGYGPILGSDVLCLIPELSMEDDPAADGGSGMRQTLSINGNPYDIDIRPIGHLSQAQGKLISLTRCEEPA